MPVDEIMTGITSLRAMMDIAKATVGLRDAEAFRSKSIEMQSLIMDALDKAIAARETQTEQADRIRALETEVTQLKAWDTEKDKYELKSVGYGAVAYMLKPEERGSEPPHWLCPTCFSQGKKAFLQPTGATVARRFVHNCQGCRHQLIGDMYPRWLQARLGESLDSHNMTKKSARKKGLIESDRHKRFLGMAREVEASDDPQEFECTLKKITRHKKNRKRPDALNHNRFMEVYMKRLHDF